MLKDSSHAIVFEAISPNTEGKIGAVLCDLQAGAVDVGCVYNKPEPQGFFEWLMPAALGLWFLDKYFGGLASDTRQGVRDLRSDLAGHQAGGRRGRARRGVHRQYLAGLPRA